jgi:DHA2 family multidrug resistance protein
VDHEQTWHPRHSPWLIATAVMAATFMEVLDTSVANVALPHIAGSLSVTTNEATWVLTSYLVSNAIILPMTGWLGNFFGRKRLLLICIALFTLASMLCGLAGDLQFLILARIFQGIGGGAMLPISQAVLLESFPPSKRGVAMATFAMGVVVAPILGPTLGGWITDNYTWRWIFYINLPAGVLAFFMSQAFVEDPPYVKRHRDAGIDYLGFGLMALGIGALQIILDKGQEEDWFQSDWICWLTLISATSLVGFIIRELYAEHPVVDLRILKNRNFTTGLALMAFVGAVLYGTTASLPIFLQTLMGYPALQSGYALSPRGIGAFITTFFVGRLIGRMPTRLLLINGFVLLAISSFWLAHINMEMGMGNVIWPSVLNGCAISFIFVPLTTATMGHLRQSQMGNATGLFNLMRNIGGSIGIAFVTTFLDRDAQIHQAMMVSHLTVYDPAFVAHAASTKAFLAVYSDPFTASAQTWHLLYGTLNQQSRLWAFVDNFRMFGLICLACVPLVFLFKKIGPQPKRRVDVH